MTTRRAAWLAGAALLAIYVATLAPSVTFWDAGEFIAAAHSLGIPHPPGTPLFVVMLTAWARLLWFVPFAVATNLLSAVCAAAAGGLTAWWISRSMNLSWAGVAAAITAGAMSSVWLNATETEVYSASLLLSLAAIAAADQAGRTGETRWATLAAYLLALALPLHLSALVAAPVVILLVTDRVNAPRSWSSGCALLGVCIAIAGASRLSPTLIAVGVLVIAASVLVPHAETRRARFKHGASMAVVSLVACSAVLFLLLRARHDPSINQADPSTWPKLAYVVGRQQYDVAGIWPRQAPMWLQLANWFEYADWQVALSLAPSVIPTVWRVLATLAFAALALIGSTWHRRTDPRGWRGVMLLLVCGSLGVLVYLNFKAGRSFGWRFVPNDALHEARDRDYFFVLGFWAWGIWAGLGAIALARRVGAPVGVGLIVAALPVALNWTAVDRRSEPEASLPRQTAAMLLDPLPARTVLFVAGDNDTYPLWYAQQVEGRRRDVRVVTMPLLGAPWYLDELDRRDGLKVNLRALDADGLAGAVARAARAAGRPVAAALSVPEADRAHIGRSWRVIGLVALETPALGSGSVPADSQVVSVDSSAVRTAARAVDIWRRGRVARPATDGTDEYFLNLLSCPGFILIPPSANPRLATRDSVCNVPER